MVDLGAKIGSVDVGDKRDTDVDLEREHHFIVVWLRVRVASTAVHRPPSSTLTSYMIPPLKAK